MKHNRRFVMFEACLLTLVLLLTGVGNCLRADSGSCSGQSITLPFTDAGSSAFFCSIAAAFFSGLTNGTTATTYSPANTVTREQMAAFITRTLDQSLRRGSPRAALGQWWTPGAEADLATTIVGSDPIRVVADGLSLWVANEAGDSVTRVNASTGAVTGTATGINSPRDLLVAKGKVFIIDVNGTLKSIDPTNPTLPVSTVISDLGANCTSLAFDGSRLWVVSLGSNQVSRITLSTPAVVDTFTGFVAPIAVLFDGANIWVTENSGTANDTLKKLGPSNGSLLLTVTLTNAAVPGDPTFDGTNLWIPALNGRVFVVRASTTTDSVLQVLTGNGLTAPFRAAFDGERVLVTNNAAAPNAGLSLWKASSLTPITAFPTANPTAGVCSDGINFWVTLKLGNGTPGKLLRF